MQTIQVIEELSFIMLDIEIWGGAKKLQPADLAQNGIDITKLPPSALATLGQKRIIDKKELHCFHADKARAERLILKTGCRFLKGYMVPNKDIKVTNDGLLEIKDNFENNRTVFLDNYEDKIEEWIASNPPEWEPIIRAAVESRESVSSKIAFGFAPVALLTPPHITDEAGENINPALDEQVNNLYGQVCHEVRLAAKESFNTSFEKVSAVTRKALRPILAIREKLKGFSFLDPLFGETIAIIDEIILQLPKSGPIEGKSLDMVAGLVGRRLSNLGWALPPEPEPEEEIDEEEEPVNEGPAFHTSYPTGNPLPPQAIIAIEYDF